MPNNSESHELYIGATEVFIDANGLVQFVYSDEFSEAMSGVGSSVTVRASHVEPSQGGWTADMAPVGGPVLGPFKSRREALDAEIAYLGAYLQSAGQTPVGEPQADPVDEPGSVDVTA